MKHALVKVVGGVVGATLLGDATIRMLSSVSSVRRLQTLSVLMLVLCQTSLAGIIAFAISLSHKYTRIAAAAWALWAYLDRAGWRNSYKSMWFRRLPMWRWFRDYFPAKLVKTAELPPEHNYVFGYHPHGILSLGVIASFGSEANEFHQTFPGIDLRVGVVNAPFFFPFGREICLFSGCISADKSSVEYSLNDGKSVLLVVGGANEALLTEEGSMNLVLANRMGFVKLAVSTGASLVPVLTFGENDTYVNVKKPWAEKLQFWAMKQMGFSLPLFYGRGVFNYDVGILPRRKPMTSVVGAPLHLEQVDPEHPEFMETVKRVHAKYVAAVVELHNTHKGQYSNVGPEEKLTLVGSSKL